MEEATEGRHQVCVQEHPPDDQHQYQRLQTAQIVAEIVVTELVVVVVEEFVLRKNSLHLVVAHLQEAAGYVWECRSQTTKGRMRQAGRMGTVNQTPLIPREQYPDLLQGRCHQGTPMPHVYQHVRWEQLQHKV